MMKDITLGQYFPGTTIVHRLDPRTKIILTLVYIIALFTAADFVSYAVVALMLAASAMVARIKAKALLSGLRPLIIVVAITAILNLFYTDGTPLVSFWVLTITYEGIKKAIFMAARIMMLVMGTFLLTYTTSPIMLTDGLESLLAPLKKIKLPVHELAMMMSIALRFIPTLIEETDKIMNAQKARGADFDTGNLVQRAKALLPILVPLFVSAFRRADELATAMESRCYHGGDGRTKLRVLKFAGADFGAFAIGAAALAAVIILGRFGL